MSIVLTCGHAQSSPDVAHALLKDVGLAEAAPSKREGLPPNDLTRKMLRASEVADSSSTPFAQISPSKVWEALTVDLMLANLEAPHWGWCDPDSIYFLDYLRDFDPRVRFCLVYSSPEHVAANYIGSQPANAGDLGDMIARWTAYNIELLRFFYRNRDRSVLVNAEAVFDTPQDFLAKARDAFGIDLSDKIAQTQGTGRDPVARLAASVLLRDARESDTLFQELESAADLPSFATTDASVWARRVWSHRHEAASHVRLSGADGDFLKQRCEAQAQENKRLLIELQNAQKTAQQHILPSESLEKSHVELQAKYEKSVEQFRIVEGKCREAERKLGVVNACRDQPTPTHVELASLETKIADADKKNEQLLLQLHQVQEELEHYFLKYMELRGDEDSGKSQDAKPTSAVGAAETAVAVAAPTTSASPVVAKQAKAPSPAIIRPFHAAVSTDTVSIVNAVDVTIDLRQFIDGENWYFAEHDGRWAGPGIKSTLRMPRLSKGRYTFELDIVDAMSPEILRGLRVTLDGAPLSLRTKNLGRVNGSANPVRRLYKKIYRGEPIWPVRVSSEIQIDAPTAEKRSTLEFQFPSVISPASRGGLDNRKLAIRVKQARICSV